MKQDQDYLQQCLQEATARKEDAATLAKLFSLKFPDFPIPHERQFNIWLRSFSRQIVADALEATAKWVEEEISKADTDEWPVYIDGPDGREELTLNRVQRYATGVMKVKRASAQTKASRRVAAEVSPEEEEIEFLDESKSTTGFNIEDEDDDLA